MLNLELLGQWSNGVIRSSKTYKTHKSYYIITDFCNGGDLNQLLEAKGGSLTEEETRIVMKKIVRGLSIIHARGIVHRDLKLANIFLDFKCPLKLSNGKVLSHDDLISLEED